MPRPDLPNRDPPAFIAELQAGLLGEVVEGGAEFFGLLLVKGEELGQVVLPLQVQGTGLGGFVDNGLADDVAEVSEQLADAAKSAGAAVGGRNRSQVEMNRVLLDHTRLRWG